MSDRVVPRLTVRLLAVALTAVVVTVAAIGAFGAGVLMRTPDDRVTQADAVIVLGGEHDGREEFGIRLAEQLSAPTVVLSNPYGRKDPVMRALCRPRSDAIEVICRPPVPSTTRGEALIVKDLAAERGWRHVVVVSWQYHHFRTGYIFGRCDSVPGGTVSFVAVPRTYDVSVAMWGYLFFYQVFSMGKAVLQGGCS